MKKFFTLKNILLCVAALFAVLAFVFSFLVNLKLTGDSTSVTFHGIIWGCNKAVETIGSVSHTDTYDPAMHAAALPLVGAILVLVGGLAACLFGFVLKGKKWAKYAVIGSACLMVLGGVFFFFTYPAFCQSYAEFVGGDTTAADIKDLWKDSNPNVALAVVAGILSILGGLSACGSQLLKK